MIDAHLHCWRLDRAERLWPTPGEGPLFADWPLTAAEAEARAAGITGAVLVQTQEDGRDTDWLLEQAEASAFVQAVVGWADPAAPDAVRRIAALATRPKLAGLRPMVQGRPDNYYDDPALDRAWAAMATQNLVLDALVRPGHLPALARLAVRHPTLRIMIDHGGKPDFDEEGAAALRRLMPLAALPNIACKLSGLLTEAKGCDIAPFVAGMLKLFGPERTAWGSDWPVVSPLAGYADWLRLARTLVPPSAHEAVFSGTARSWYRLEERA